MRNLLIAAAIVGGAYALGDGQTTRPVQARNLEVDILKAKWREADSHCRWLSGDDAVDGCKKSDELEKKLNTIGQCVDDDRRWRQC